MNKVSVEILADSVNRETGDRITTFLLNRFPYCLLQEPATHRKLSGSCLSEPLGFDWNCFGKDVSRNTASTRAVPIAKIISSLREDPYLPQWTGHQPGMVGKDCFSASEKADLDKESIAAMERAIVFVLQLQDKGVSKQDANRYLVPWLRIPILVTATEWDNFFDLRTKEDVQPVLREIAIEMREHKERSRPQVLNPYDWHLPFAGQWQSASTLLDKLKVATARSARLSYLAHDCSTISIERDYRLHDDLLRSRHLSPFEHSAMAVPAPSIDCRNFKGFFSYRASIEEPNPYIDVALTPNNAIPPIRSLCQSGLLSNLQPRYQ